MTRRDDRYAAFAAAKRGHFAAVTPDMLDLLNQRNLQQLQTRLGYLPVSPEREAAMALVRDEMRRRVIDAVHAEEMKR